jgi:hypothetical protein
LLALATQIAQDYCDSLKARLDEVYPGVTPWAPDGVNDVTFLHQHGVAWTRVQGPPLNGGVSELQHSLGPLEVPESSPANVKTVLITSWACKDDPSKTTCNGTGPSPHCYYPGKLQTLTCAGWDNGEDVWVVFTLENMLTPIAGTGGAPPTLLVIGTRVEASSKGFSYAPDNMGSPAVHPNNGESRPVWGSDFYAAGVAIGCGPPPTLTYGGEAG